MNARTPNCPLCEADKAEVWIKAPEAALDASVFGSSRQSVSPGTILRCRVCGCGFRETAPTQEQLTRMYAAMDPQAYEAESASRARTALTHLGLLRRYANPGRLLDVGCASGVFLERAASAGWNVLGIEPSERLFEQASARLGRDAVLRTVLSDSDLPPNSFDAITLWDVLEHVTEPVERNPAMPVAAEARRGPVGECAGSSQHSSPYPGAALAAPVTGASDVFHTPGPAHLFRAARA